MDIITQLVFRKESASTLGALPPCKSLWYSLTTKTEWLNLT